MKKSVPVAIRILFNKSCTKIAEISRALPAPSYRLRKIKILISAFLIFGSMSLSFAQNIKVDVRVLTQETQQMSPGASEMTLIWWIPEEFWRVSFEQNPEITADQAEDFLKVLRPYTVILVVDGKVGGFGGITYKPQATIQNNIQIADKEGTYLPLVDEKIDPDAKNFLSMMKPVFVNMLGPMGANMHFFLFPSLNKKGKKIADAKSEGAFSVKLDTREFKWRLPLGSLLPPKGCPVDGEKMSGGWKYCPWHGVELK